MSWRPNHLSRSTLGCQLSIYPELLTGLNYLLTKNFFIGFFRLTSPMKASMVTQLAVTFEIPNFRAQCPPVQLTRTNFAFLELTCGRLSLLPVQLHAAGKATAV